MPNSTSSYPFNRAEKLCIYQLEVSAIIVYAFLMPNNHKNQYNKC